MARLFATHIPMAGSPRRARCSRPSPPRRLVHTFSATWDDQVTPDAPHRVIWTLEPMGTVTKVTVEHFDFAGETATYKSVTGGLSLILNGMKTLLETGAALTIGA